MDPTNIQKSALGNLIKLGRGGQGTVFKAPRAQLTLQGKAFFGEAVHKEYHSDKLNEIEVSVLREMVAFLATLPFADGANLIARAAWPVCLVEEGSEIVGFLMPCIPSPFTINFRLPSGVSKLLNAEFQHLLNDDKFLSDHGITLTDRDRYALLYELAASLDLFHGHKIAVGDLSPKNVLFSLSPKPSVYFIDCDSMEFRGKAVLPQVETPSWDIRTISSSQDLATPQTDRYKFGLFVLRLFSGDQTTRDHSRLPSNVPAVVRSMVERSLSPNAQYRPEMREWLKPLKEAERSAAKVQTPLPPIGSSSGTQTTKLKTPIQRPITPNIAQPTTVTHSPQRPFWLPLLLLAVFITYVFSNQDELSYRSRDAPPSTSHPVEKENAYVNALELNLRDGPGPEYKVRTKLSQGDLIVRFETAQSSDGGSWVRVRADSFEGWVNEKLLSRTPPDRKVQEGHKASITITLGQDCACGNAKGSCDAEYSGNTIGIIWHFPIRVLNGNELVPNWDSVVCPRGTPAGPISISGSKVLAIGYWEENQFQTYEVNLKVSRSNNGFIGPEDIVPAEMDKELDACRSRAGWYECFQRINPKLAEIDPDAMEIQRVLELDAWLREFREKGRVDLARVDEMTSNHMDSHYVLVNGTPKIIWVTTDQQVDAAIERHPLYPTLLTKYRAANPEAFQYSEPRLFPARFSGLNREETLPDGGQRFVFAHALLACMGCAMGGDALVAYDFDRNGNFLGQTLLDLFEPDPEEAPDKRGDGVVHKDNDNKHDYVRQMLSSSMNSDESGIQEARKAIEQLPPVSRGDRKTARAGNDQGLKYLNAGQFSEATSVLERARQADPGDVEITNNLGYAYFMHGDLESAERNILNSLSLAPGRTSAWTNLGQVYAGKGDEQSAAGSFANAYRFSKNRLKTRDFLIRLTQEVDSAVLKNSAQQATRFAENNFLELSQAEQTDRPTTREEMSTDDKEFWNDFSGKAARFQNQ